MRTELVHDAVTRMMGVAFIDSMPDGQEFGLVLMLDAVVETVGDVDPELLDMGRRSLESYRHEHAQQGSDLKWSWE